MGGADLISARVPHLHVLLLLRTEAQVPGEGPPCNRRDKCPLVKAGFLRDPDRLRAVATVALVNATSRHGNKVISQRYSTRTVFRGIAAQNGPSFSVHPCAERVMAIVNVPGLGAGALRGAPSVFPTPLVPVALPSGVRPSEPRRAWGRGEALGAAACPRRTLRLAVPLFLLIFLIGVEQNKSTHSICLCLTLTRQGSPSVSSVGPTREL